MGYRLLYHDWCFGHPIGSDRHCGSCWHSSVTLSDGNISSIDGDGVVDGTKDRRTTEVSGIDLFGLTGRIKKRKISK
jgi:hypothetical protein